MTPDELPADMEGLAANLLADLSVLAATARGVPFDVWDRFANNVQQAAALLKAYQEQRRALEEAADSFARIQTYVGGRNIDFVSTFARAEYGEKRARAALNQKGDER
jgi:hypothetical protein